MSDSLPTALLTCHGKEVALSDPLAKIGYAIFTFSQFDTDSLGTFTREIAREGTMLDAAKRKAHLACSLTGARFGIGSEGSFGSDPWIGMTSWGREILVWYDKKRGLEVSAFVQGSETNYASKRVNTMDDALVFAAKIGFPEHGIIVGSPGEVVFNKSCNDAAELTTCVLEALQHGPVDLSTDMRAHRNPTRMLMIARCAQDLAHRLATRCPLCRVPGFGTVAPIPGAPCEECGLPTQQPRAMLLRCVTCAFEAEKSLYRTVSANSCNYCNP